MRYGYFDNEKREYVIDRVDIPTSWTNYIGVTDMCAVLNHTAGGYIFYKSPEYHRITRFRPNGVPMDRPGHYVYLRDDENEDYWSISWQPVGKPLDQATGSMGKIRLQGGCLCVQWKGRTGNHPGKFTGYCFYRYFYAWNGWSEDDRSAEIRISPDADQHFDRLS